MDVVFLLFVWFDLFAPTSTQHYTCPSNKDCIQDCTTSSCVNYIIQAANAASLHVTCSNGYCSGIQISCPYDTTATCNVECTNSNACKDAVINYPQPQNVKLKCSGSSACTGVQLLGPETFSDTTVISSATIQCLGTSTCNDATFDLNYVYNVDISCQYASKTPSCDGLQIHAKYASDVAIHCHYHDCSNLYVDATSVTNEITLDCNGDYACGASSSVHVAQANHFTLKCASSHYSCLSVDIYPNQDDYHANEVSCAGTGCHAVSVHVNDDYILDYLDFTTTTTTIDSVRFVCDSRGTSHLFYNTTTQQFECDIKRCCPWMYGDIVCDTDHGNCTINCIDEYGSYGCRNKVIDAVNATTLNVICSSTNSTHGGCEDAVVFCPRNMVHKYGGDYLECNVKCEDERACWAADVYSYDDDELNILCNNNLSCTMTTINAVNTKQSNIICTSTDYFELYGDIIPIEYPYHDTYHYFTSFSDKNMDGWGCSGNYKNNYCAFMTDYGNSLIISSQSSSNLGNLYQDAYKSFDMKYASNIKLDVYIAHDIKNSIYWNGQYMSYAYIFYNCGAGWSRLEGFCHKDNEAKECTWTDAGYGELIHRSYNLPARCNYNTDVQVKFEAVGVSQSARMYVKDVTVIGASDLYVGACCDIDVDAQRQSTFNLECKGTTACVNNTINVQHAQNVTTSMIATQADIKGVINAQWSDVLNVNCGSRYSAHFVDACWHTMFYGNNKSNALNCESYGCNTLNMYSLNGIADWTVDVRGCMESQHMRNSVSHWNILCGDDYTSPTGAAVFNGNTCDSNDCGCHLLYTDTDKVTSSYDTIDECVLETPDIICSPDVDDCNIHCTNCSQTAVTGAASQSLTVLCDDSCYKSLIYCPFHNKCEVQCDGKENTCDGTEIYGGVDQDIVIECKHNNSCNFVEIYANTSANIDLYCSDYLSCNNISVYAMHLNQSINIFCTSLYSCNSNTIHANYASDVSINCQSNYSCNNMVLHANYIHNLTLNCLTNTACNFLSFYTNFSQIADINCYSYSAQDASSASCNHLSLYGSHVSTHIHWRCFGDYACSHNELHAEHSNDVHVIAYGDRALYYGHIFARNANNYNLSCLSSSADMFTCFSSTMQGPAKDTTYPYDTNAFLDCYGHGCYSLNLDSDSGFDDWSIYFNGCGACTNITSCFDYWYLTCSDLTTLDDHWKLNYYYGDSCKIMTDDDCKCVSYIDKLSQHFANDYNALFCDFKPSYLSFTSNPTAMPTPLPTDHPSYDPSYAPTSRPTQAPSQPMPTKQPTNIPSNTPSASPTNIPSVFSTDAIQLDLTSTVHDDTTPIHTNNQHKMDSQSIATFFQDNVLYIAVGGGAFVCCVLLCCVGFVCLYCKKKKQMQRVLDQLDAQSNDVELADTRTKPKSTRFGNKSKNNYEKFTD